MSEFYAEAARMFSKTFLQKEIVSAVCYNYSLPTMQEPFKITEKIFKYVIQEYSSSSKILSSEDFKQLQVYETIINKHLNFLKQLNEITLFNKMLGKAPVLLPDLELFAYSHSYSNIRLLLNILNCIINSESKVHESISSYMETVIEYVKPTLLFLWLIGSDLITLIERAKTARSENKESHDCGAISVNLKHLQEKLPKKIYSALQQSITVCLEKPEVTTLLLNQSSVAFHEYFKKFCETATSNANRYQIIGELILLKILNDIANDRNGTSIISVLLGILRLYDSYGSENNWKLSSVIPNYRRDDSWHSKAIFSLLEELLQNKEAHPLSLIEDCVSFLCSYWGQGDWEKIVKQERNQYLEKIKKNMEIVQ